MTDHDDEPITIEHIAAMVYCPTCEACLMSDDPESCWDASGANEAPFHDERLTEARKILAEARRIVDHVADR
jgi:hypothetical protein